jgi:methyl-accepting chemotaxis protein
LRKLAGLAGLEDALKRLDRLTQEEARMAHAEVLGITHNIREEVTIIDGKVERVDDKVDGVGDRVDEVGGKVEHIGDQVQSVDDKVQVVIDGSRGLFRPFLNPFSHVYFKTART